MNIERVESAVENSEGAHEKCSFVSRVMMVYASARPTLFYHIGHMFAGSYIEREQRNC